MNTVLVRMLCEHKQYKAGESYEIDADTAEKWVEVEIAEKVSATSAIEKEINSLKATFEESQANLVNKMSEAIKTAKAPAINIKSENDEGSVGDWLKSIYNAYSGKTGAQDYLHNKYYKGTKAQNTQSGTAGGFLVPDQFLNTFYAAKNEEAIVRPRASVVMMSGNTMKIPALDQTTNMRGGVVTYYTDEVNSGITETSLKTRQIELHTHDLCGLILATNDMLQDSAFNFDQFIGEQLRLAVIAREDKEYLVGKGVNGPLGILNAAATISVTRNTASHIKFDDIVAMETKMLPEAFDSCVWVAHQSAMSDIAYLRNSLGTPIYLESGREGGFPSLRGRPVLFTGKTSALGTKGDFFLCDFSSYYVGLRQDVTVEVSQHVKFTQNQVAYRVVYRHDGQPAVNAAITLDDGSTTVSPFVVLAT